MSSFEKAKSEQSVTQHANKSSAEPSLADQIDPSRSIEGQRVVYLMRGLPSCGKSHRSRELAGAHGVICETDQFFYTQVGKNVDKYDYQADRQQEARDWNYQRFFNAVDVGAPIIVVDRGNGLNLETVRYAKYAADRGCTLLLAEPDSPWWQEIRVLLKYKQYTGPVLDRWAERLAKMNRSTHRTPKKTIRRWMQRWNSSLTVDAILNYQQGRSGERA